MNIEDFKFGPGCVQRVFKVARSCEDMDHITADWTVSLLDKIEFKTTPTRSKEVAAYEEIPREVRQQFPSEYFKDHPGILAYYGMVDKVRRENKSNYDWLIQCRKVLIGKKEIDKVRLIDQKIDQITAGDIWPERN